MLKKLDLLSIQFKLLWNFSLSVTKKIIVISMKCLLINENHHKVVRCILLNKALFNPLLHVLILNNSHSLQLHKSFWNHHSIFFYKFWNAILILPVYIYDSFILSFIPPHSLVTFIFSLSFSISFHNKIGIVSINFYWGITFYIRK